MRGKMGRWYRFGLLLCMALLWLTACNQSENDCMRSDKSGTDKKESMAPEKTPVAEGVFGDGYSAANYQYGNSTNLYKNLNDWDSTMEEISHKEEAVFAQYDLEGHYVRDIVLDGGALWLVSVDDSWLYYTAWRKAWNKGQMVICRLPVMKQDGVDVIDTSKEEILLAPEHFSDEEKKLGIKEKEYEFGGSCYITSKYVICIVEADVGREEYGYEIIRYNLQTKEFSYNLYGVESDYYGDMLSEGYVSASEDTLVLCGGDGVFLLDVDSLAVSQLSGDDYEEDSSHALLTADGNTFCFLAKSYNLYDEEDYEEDYEDDEEDYDYGDDEVIDSWMMIYSLKKNRMRTVMPPEKLQNAVCKAEGAKEDTVYNIAYDLLGSYRDKIYLRYLFEQEQENNRSAHYGVLSLSLDDLKFCYEKEISEAVQGESVPFHGQWIRYQKVSKQEKKAAKKAGRKPKKSIDKQYALTVNLGNPQRVIGNQLFFRSINQRIEQNGWYVYCLDTNKYEKLTSEDSRNEWIYLQNGDGWDYTYLSATEEMLCIDDYDDYDLVKVVWDELKAEVSSTEEASAGSVQAISEREQLQYIAGHRYEWMWEIEDYFGGIEKTIDSYDEVELGYSLDYANYECGLKYIVTDLNQNGRLEVIVLNQAGSGAFTDICAYEYSYKTQSLQSAYPSDNHDWRTVPDIGELKKTDVYYDNKHKMYWYYGEDFWRENYVALCLWGIDVKGVYRDSLVAHLDASDDEKKPIYYYIGDKKVSKEEFKKKRKNMEPNMKKGKATLCWQQDGQALVEMSDEKLLEKLTKSWEGFSVEY